MSRGGPAQRLDFSAFIPPVGNYRCGCGASLELPGICSACGSKPQLADYEEVERLTRDARLSIPERYRWANFRNPLLAKRVDNKALAALRDLKEWPISLTLVGGRDAGKTSLVAAMLNRIHERARPGMRLDKVKLIGRCLFVDYLDVLKVHRRMSSYKATEEDEREWNRLVHAYRLVVDNVEPDRHDGPVGSLCQERFKLDLRTLYTSYMTEAEAGQHFGGGVAKRMYQTVITMEPVPKVQGEQA